MTKFSEPFLQIAADIDRNPEDSFGGSFCIVLPSEDGLPNGLEIKGVILGVKDATQALSLISTQIKLVIDGMTQMHQQVSTFGRMR